MGGGGRDGGGREWEERKGVEGKGGVRRDEEGGMW